MVSAMDAAPATAQDGFNQAFGLLVAGREGPDGPGAVAKQGWMCCFSAQTYLHSSGAVGADDRFLVVLLTRAAAHGRVGCGAGRAGPDRDGCGAGPRLIVGPVCQPRRPWVAIGASSCCAGCSPARGGR